MLQLQTPRLLLRNVQPEDIDFWESLDGDSEVRRYFPSGTQNRQQTEERIKKFISHYEEQGLPVFSVFERETGEFVGRAGFGPVETGEIEVGYVLHKKFWGKGYAVEAVTALLSWAMQHIDADYIIAYADIDNTASFRVMEKCGMEFYRNGVSKGLECRFYRVKNRG